MLKRDQECADLTIRKSENGKDEKVFSKKLPEGLTGVENYKGVLQYMCQDFKRSITLTRDLRDELTRLFGKHNARVKSEFSYFVWIVEFGDEVFCIFSAKDKGTQFTIVAKLEDDKSKVCIAFLRKMQELVDNCH